MIWQQTDYGEVETKTKLRFEACSAEGMVIFSIVKGRV